MKREKIKKIYKILRPPLASPVISPQQAGLPGTPLSVRGTIRRMVEGCSRRRLFNQPIQSVAKQHLNVPQEQFMHSLCNSCILIQFMRECATHL